MADDEQTTLICMPATWPAIFVDDVLDHVCATCGVQVRHRPHAPIDVRYLCGTCFKAEIQASGQQNVEIQVSQETIQELKLLFSFLQKGVQ
jgi:hypothetical protein